MKIIFKHGKKGAEPQEFSFAEALTHIRETASEAESAGYDPGKLRCKGCINSCLLSSPRCAFGERVVRALEAAKNEKAE